MHKYYLISNPKIKEQVCLSGDCENGYGTYIYPSGDIYVEEYKDGKRNGQGTYTFPDGKFLKGFWENDQFIDNKKKD